jgi:hypothetical protein
VLLRAMAKRERMKHLSDLRKTLESVKLSGEGKAATTSKHVVDIK